MNMLDLYDKVKQAKEEDQKVICFISLNEYFKYQLYFVRDILDPNIPFNDYDYEEVKGIEYATVSIKSKDNKFEQTKVGIHSGSLSQIIRDSWIIDFDMDSKKIIERFILYMNYFFPFSNDLDPEIFLYLYDESIYNQRKVAKQLGIPIQSLYDNISIDEMSPLSRRSNLLNCKSLKYKYIGMVYVNVYTFDIYLQLHYRPNVDVLIIGITRPVAGNLLINILPGDSSEQIISQYFNFHSDFIKILKHK